MVIYDRAYSAFSSIDLEEVNWDYVAAARVLHLTGITPGLSPNYLALVHKALEVAKQVGQMVSFDLNYRAKIWTPEEAVTALSEIMPMVDVLLAGREEVETVFGVEGPTVDLAVGLHERFGIDLVVLTAGELEVVAYDGRPHTHGAYEIETVDRVGAGDDTPRRRPD